MILGLSKYPPNRGGDIGVLGVLSGQHKFRLNLRFLLFEDVIPEFPFVKYLVVLICSPY